jgi:hypothetical protein
MWASQGPNPNVTLSTPTGSVAVNGFAASGTNTTQSIGVAPSTVTLTSNTIKLAEVTIRGDCAADVIPNGTVCVARRSAPLASVAVLAFGAGYVPQVIHVFADGTFQKLSPYVDTTFAIGNCVIRRAVQPASQPLSCGTDDGRRVELSWIKATNRIVPYDGLSGVLPPVTDSASPDGFWLDVSDPDLVRGWDRSYATAAGLFFATGQRDVLWFVATGTSTERQVSGDLSLIKAITGF